MSSELKSTCFYIWRNKYERRISTGDFKPIFKRYIGVENKDNYDDILKTFSVKFEENKNLSLLFDGSIPMSGEFELINHINNELATMDIYNMQGQDIILFNDETITIIFVLTWFSISIFRKYTNILTLVNFIM